MSDGEGRDLVAREFAERVTDPRDAAQVAAFYRDSRCLAADLDDWHRRAKRQDWTRAIVEVATGNGVNSVLDVGCGAGQDLQALKAAGITGLLGVEPNDALRWSLAADGLIEVMPDLDGIASSCRPDLTICIDVLEHVSDPAALVAQMAQHIPVGGLLIESTATDDVTTPLHLRSNWGWKPDGQLIGLGFAPRQKAERFRVWQREGECLPAPTQSACIAVWRNVEWHSTQRLMELYRTGWNVVGAWNDGLIPRARARAVAEWWRSTPDDVFLMLDGDIVYNPIDAARIVERCRQGYDVVCAPYVVRDGTHLAGVVGLDEERIEFRADAEPLPSIYAATGFLAVHRRVIDALIRDKPCMEPESKCPFWDIFPVGPKGNAYLSEDYGFSELVRAAGFTIWTDSSIRLGHIGSYMYLPEDLGRPKREHQDVVVWETRKNPAYAVTMRGPFAPHLFESVSGFPGNGSVSIWRPGQLPVAVA